MINNNFPVDEIITPENILTKIWFSPKEVFKFIANYKYDKHVTLILILSGIVKAFDKAISKNMGDHLPLWGVICCSLLIGITFGWFFNILYAAAISRTGKWFGGKSNTKSILNVLAYAILPSILSLFITILQISIYGNAVFQSNQFDLYSNVSDNVIYWTFYSIDLILLIWSVILLVIGISVIQRISIGKAILNIILPGFLLVLILLTIFIISDLFFN
ncbi:YIP1 family protein [Flavobacterium sp.]|uniref:YIP1 family protein n=1 Tax=Flavobacterium sp. TaxID=239 RepID=UPI0032641242